MSRSYSPYRSEIIEEYYYRYRCVYDNTIKYVGITSKTKANNSLEKRIYYHNLNDYWTKISPFVVDYINTKDCPYSEDDLIYYYNSIIYYNKALSYLSHHEPVLEWKVDELPWKRYKGKYLNDCNCESENSKKIAIADYFESLINKYINTFDQSIMRKIQYTSTINLYDLFCKRIKSILEHECGFKCCVEANGSYILITPQNERQIKISKNYKGESTITLAYNTATVKEWNHLLSLANECSYVLNEYARKHKSISLDEIFSQCFYVVF